MLSTRSATALYVGAVLGPGVLLLPALAAEAAGPASVLAWAGLLALSAPLATTFAALGVRFPEAGGTAAYAQAAFGRLTGAVTGWWFLDRRRARRARGGAHRRLLRRRAAGRGPDRRRHRRGGDDRHRWRWPTRSGCTTTAQAPACARGPARRAAADAVLTALPESHAANWTPFAPHGWAAVGTAASLLMLSFIGWEAVSHLAGDLRDPARQLPRAIFAALGVVVVLYLGLAIATRRRARHRGAVEGAARGPDGRRPRRARPHRHRRARRAADDGRDERLRRRAVKLAGALAADGPRPAGARAAAPRADAVRGRRPASLLAAARRGRLQPRRPVRATSASFVAVYVTATAAGARLLDGAARWAAGIAFAAVLVVLAFSGPYLLVPAVVAVAALTAARARRTSTAALKEWLERGCVTNVDA